MPLVFLITYGVLSQILYTKSGNAPERTRLVLQLQGVLAFLLLFFFLVFASEEYSGLRDNYVTMSFEVLAIGYGLIFSLYAYLYNARLKAKGFVKRMATTGAIERWIDTAYLVFLLAISGFSLVLHLLNDRDISLCFLDIVVLSATAYVLWQWRFLRSELPE